MVYITYTCKCITTSLSLSFSLPPSFPLSLPPHPHKTLETVAYEVSLNLQEAQGGQADYSVRLVLVLMSTLAKVASRCQDLVPRALLCLNKIAKLGKVCSYMYIHVHVVIVLYISWVLNFANLEALECKQICKCDVLSAFTKFQKQTNKQTKEYLQKILAHERYVSIVNSLMIID